MRVSLVLVFVSVAAASALGYSGMGTGHETAAAAQAAWQANEPAALLLSGSLLLGLAGVVKRFSL